MRERRIGGIGGGRGEREGGTACGGKRFPWNCVGIVVVVAVRK